MFNLLTRFAWICYILVPSRPNVTAKTPFIVATIEVLRRAHWNICTSAVYSLPEIEDVITLTHEDRLKSEQLGNKDQYRVTREVPLPYILPDGAEDEGDACSERCLVGHSNFPSVSLSQTNAERFYGP